MKIAAKSGEEEFEIDLETTGNPMQVALEVSKSYGRLVWILVDEKHKHKWDGTNVLTTFKSGMYQKHQPFDSD